MNNDLITIVGVSVTFLLIGLIIYCLYKATEVEEPEENPFGGPKKGNYLRGLTKLMVLLTLPCVILVSLISIVDDVYTIMYVITFIFVLGLIFPFVYIATINRNYQYISVPIYVINKQWHAKIKGEMVPLRSAQNYRLIQLQYPLNAAKSGLYISLLQHKRKPYKIRLCLNHTVRRNGDHYFVKTFNTSEFDFTLINAL
jgi:hypothetical protein